MSVRCVKCGQGTTVLRTIDNIRQRKCASCGCIYETEEVQRRRVTSIISDPAVEREADEGMSDKEVAEALRKDAESNRARRIREGKPPGSCGPEEWPR